MEGAEAMETVGMVVVVVAVIDGIQRIQQPPVINRLWWFGRLSVLQCVRLVGCWHAAWPVRQDACICAVYGTQ